MRQGAADALRGHPRADPTRQPEACRHDARRGKVCGNHSAGEDRRRLAELLSVVERQKPMSFMPWSVTLWLAALTWRLTLPIGRQNVECLRLLDMDFRLISRLQFIRQAELSQVH